MGGRGLGCCSPRLGVHSARVTHTSDAHKVSPDQTRSHPCGGEVNKRIWVEELGPWPAWLITSPFVLAGLYIVIV